MANTISSGLQNNIISQSALEQFTSILSPVSAFSTSFNDDAQNRGDTITVLNLGNTSVAGNFGGDYSGANTTWGQTQISLDKHKFVSWYVTDAERSESSAVELSRFGYQMGGDLALAVFQDILSEVTIANFADSVGVASGSFGVDDIASMREEAVGNNLPIDNTALVLSPAYFGNLIQDSAVASALAYGGSDAIREGKVPSLFGIPAVYESNAIPLNSEALKGFLAHPCSLAVAMRYLEPGNTQEYISAKKISDPETGMVMGYREYYEASSGKHTAVLECVYGYETGRGEGLIRLTT